jgi:hypothetical protein
MKAKLDLLNAVVLASFQYFGVLFGHSFSALYVHTTYILAYLGTPKEVLCNNSRIQITGHWSKS